MRIRDEDGFELFARSAMPRLLRTAWLLTGDPTRAEDCVQEALTRLYAVWPRVRGDEPEAYCHRILRNLLVSTWRKDRRLVMVGEVRDQPQEGTSDRHERVDLVRALQSMPAREREVVVLRHYADLPERVVAEMLGVSLGTVKSSASRGLERLRVLMSDQGDSHVR